MTANTNTNTKTDTNSNAKAHEAEAETDAVDHAPAIGANRAMPYIDACRDEGTVYLKTRDVAEWLGRSVSQTAHVMLELEARGELSRWGEAQPITWRIATNE